MLWPSQLSRMGVNAGNNTWGYSHDDVARVRGKIEVRSPWGSHADAY